MMGWWSKEPDAIERLCELLQTKWWEWTEINTDDGAQLTHLSSVTVLFGAYDHYSQRRSVCIGQKKGNVVSASDAHRLWLSYQEHLAAKASSRKTPFDATAKALATAILNGETDAVYGLMDLLTETMGERQ